MTGAAIISVPALLARGAAAPAHVDPVDAVMGEDWARLRLGRGGAARDLSPDLGRAGARRRRAAIGGVLSPNPQALVKLIGSGGAKNGQGLRAQMAYLGRNGDVPLLGSESNFGLEIRPDDVAGLAGAWGMPERDRGGADRTSHFVVSFPEGTDPAAAERAGRAWAAALFDSGAQGERWDYYTAFHSDTAYPHIHVVVSRRGLDEGRWLTISNRSGLSFDRLREVQIEVAAREGIALTGTSRLARGVHDRPVPDAEYRRAAREGREPVPPAHTEVSAVHAAAMILTHARDYEGAAASLRPTDAHFADRLDRAAATLLEGRELLAAGPHDIGLTQKETERMVEKIAEVQAEIRRNFAEIARELETVRDPSARADFTRQLAELRAEGAEMLRGEQGLQSYRSGTAHDDYRGVAEASVRDAEAESIKAEADRKVARLAERHGLDPAASLARYATETVSRGLGRDYRSQEYDERAERREAEGKPPESLAEAKREIEAFHEAAREVYRDLAGRLSDRAAGREAPERSAEARASERAQAPDRGPDRAPERAPERDAPESRSEARPARSRDRDDERSR